MNRLARTFVSLAAAMMAYWAYALLAVPWMEPSTALRDGKAGPVEETFGRRIDVSAYFKEGQWQRSRTCKVIETPQGVLLFQEMKPSKGQIKLEPVSLVLFAKGDEETGGKDSDKAPDDSATRRKRPIILDAPDGVELVSDGSMNLARLKLGGFVGGHMLGQVTMRSPDDVAEDQRLFLQTRNVQIDQSKIWTPSEVRFQYGLSHGRGRDLSISMSPREGEKGRLRSPLGELQMLELVHVDELRMQLADSRMFPFGTKSPPGAAGVATDKEPMTLLISCQGPFKFNFATATASFVDQVNVIRPVRHGRPDRLSCDKLEIAAAPRDGRAEPAAAGNLTGMTIGQLTAFGNPVTLQAPSVSASAVSQVLKYHAAERRIMLDDPRQVTLQFEEMGVVSKRIEYEMPDDPKRLGRMWAQGPGVIQGRMRKEGMPPIIARWGRLLQLEPQQNRHVFSFYEAASIGFGEQGADGGISADKLHLYVSEVARRSPPGVPAATNKPEVKYDIVPDRVRAIGNVGFDSEVLSGRTRALSAFFVQPTAAAAPRLTGGVRPPLAAPRSRTEKRRPAARKFDVEGQRMEVQLVLRKGEDPAVNDVTVAGAVRVNQTKLAKKDSGPLRMSGERLRIMAQHEDAHHVEMLGRPAKVSVGGASIQGNQIHVDQATNRLWIDGGGEMTFPSSRSQPGTASPTTTVRWEKGMQFDGRVAQFQERILATGARRDKRGQWMRYTGRSAYLAVEVAPPLVFAKLDKKTEKVELRSLNFDGGVAFDNQTLDPRGGMASQDHLRTNNLTINQLTGELRVDGPGWGSTVRYAKDRFLKPRGSQAPPQRKSDPRLIFLSVKFENGAAGNLHDREVSFLGNAKAVYGPVKTWDDHLDAERRDGLGEKGVRLQADRIQVTDIGVGDDPVVELVASGNAVVENERFLAQGHRVSYTEAKQLLILEGSGLYDARLRVFGRNAKSAIARRISVWTDTYDFEVDRAKNVQLGSFGRSPSEPPRPLPRRR